MISLFRKIRRGLLKDGALWRYSAYAIGEIALIVVGILLALMINDWSSEREFRETEISILQVMKSSLLEDREKLVSSIEVVGSRIERIEKLKVLLGNPPQYDPSHDQLFGAVYGIQTLRMNTVPYETLKAEGLHQVGNSKLRYAIVEVYESFLKVFEGFNEMEQTMNWELFQPYYYMNFANIQFSQSAIPVDYQALVNDRAYINLVEYRLIVLKANQGKIYPQTLEEIDRLLELIDEEIGNKTES